MAYSSDSDLQKMLPTIFSYGITSFAGYHQPAADELARDIRRLWLRRQTTVTLQSFDPDSLDEEQMKLAACLRVLAWHVLPRLALEQPVIHTRTDAESGSGSETTGEPTTTNESSKDGQRTTTSSPSFIDLAKNYKQAYREELANIIDDGVRYNGVWIPSTCKAETQRFIR